MADGEWIESYVPARLDRMPWSRWHWLIVIALGATWILDGLEVTLAGSLGGILTRRETLGLRDAQVGASATFYLAGAVLGALLFGYATDRLGRKRLFFITVAVYLTASGLTATRAAAHSAVGGPPRQPEGAWRPPGQPPYRKMTPSLMPLPVGCREPIPPTEVPPGTCASAPATPSYPDSVGTACGVNVPPA